MSGRTGGSILAEVLQRAGVTTVFTLHGGHLDPLFQGMRELGIRAVDTRHEQAAGHAAEGWARFTRTLGVCAVTAGPGFTDVLTAITHAHLDCFPVLVIGSSAPLRDAERLPLQGGLDQVAMAVPVTKWAHRVTSVDRVADLAEHAVRIATTGRPGPVYLEVPIDVLFRELDADRVRFARSVAPPHPPAPAPQAVAEILDLLANAARPAVLAGGGAWLAGAAAPLEQLASIARLPVFTNPKAHGIVGTTPGIAGGRFGNLKAAERRAGEPADVVVLLGARQGMNTGGRGSPLIATDATVVQVDLAAEEIGRNRAVDVGVVADCARTVEALLTGARGRSWPGRTEWLDAVQQAAAPGGSEPGDDQTGPAHPLDLARNVLRALPRDAIVCVDGGEIASWVESVAAPACAGSWANHGYLGCLGIGLPFALAAQVAHPDRVVCCITGDGAVGFNFMELDSMVRHGLPVVTVVANDGIWAMSAHGQDALYGSGHRVASELGDVRYDLAAAGLGCHAERVEEAAAIGPAIERALASGRPALIDVVTDADVVHPSTAKLGRRPPTSSASPVMPYYEQR